MSNPPTPASARGHIEPSRPAHTSSRLTFTRGSSWPLTTSGAHFLLSALLLMGCDGGAQSDAASPTDTEERDLDSAAPELPEHTGEVDGLDPEVLPSDTVTGDTSDDTSGDSGPASDTTPDTGGDTGPASDTTPDTGGDTGPTSDSTPDTTGDTGPASDTDTDTAGGDTADTAAPVAVDGETVRCLGHGWCWDLPEIGGAHVHGVWGASADGIWAVGSAGAITYFDGLRWVAVASPVTSDLDAVHGTGPRDVWAVGASGEILRFDGERWTRSGSGVSTRLRAVWARAPDDAWAVGDSGTVLRWDGIRWRPLDSGVIRSLRSVSGFAADDVWIVGDHAAILHYDGDALTKVFEINSASRLNTVVAVGPSECWAFGDGGLARHQFVSAGSSSRIGEDDLFGAAATAFDDLWVVGDGGTVGRWDGLDWDLERLESMGELRALWTDGVDAWAGGRYGARARFDGADGHWGFEDGHLGPDAIVDLVVVDATRAFALTERWIYRRSELGWERFAEVEMPSPAAFWVEADDLLWVVGADEAIDRWDGAQWARVPFNALGTRDNRGIWGSGPDDIFVAAGPDLYHWNGAIWRHEEQISSSVLEVFLRDGLRLVVTSQGIYERHWLAGWRQLAPPPSAPTFSAATLGGEGRIALTDGKGVWTFDPHVEDAAAWRKLDPPQVFTLQGAWAPGGSEVWALGEGRELWRWNGTAWSNPVLVPEVVAFQLGASPEAAYAFSWAGHVLRRSPN